MIYRKKDIESLAVAEHQERGEKPSYINFVNDEIDGSSPIPGEVGQKGSPVSHQD